MTLIEEFKGGKYSIYAQWLALATFIVLVAIGIALLPNIPIGWLFGIFALCIAGVSLLLELPIVTRCCPTRGWVGNMIAFFESNLFRAFLYLGFTILMYAGASVTLITLIPAIMLMFIAGFYGLAFFKGQELHRSMITGGKGIATASGV